MSRCYQYGEYVKDIISMNFVGIIKKWSIIIVSNYFLLYAINGLLGMLGLSAIAKLDLLIMLAASVITLFYLHHGITKLDAFIIFFIGSIAFIGFVQNYNKELWYAGCRGQLYYMIFFFVGRYCGYENIPILQKGVWPFLIVCIIGLILYILSPSWYMDYKLQMWEDSLSDDRILEMTRLSAFWVYPYWVSYGCAIMYCYLMTKCLLQGYMEKKEMIVLIFIAFIALLTQQRAPMFIIALTTMIFIVMGLFKKKKKGHISLRSSLFYFILIVMCMLIIFLSVIDTEMLIRLMEKVEVLENASTFLDDRASIFSDFRSKSISLFGDGIGRYSHVAYNMGKQAITDQQYMQILYETGYMGCIGYGIIFFIVLFKGLKNFSLNYLELTIILMYFLAMTGANCLSTFAQHTAIFWICCGRVCNQKLLLEKIKNPTYLTC